MQWDYSIVWLHSYSCPDLLGFCARMRSTCSLPYSCLFPFSPLSLSHLATASALPISCLFCVRVCATNIHNNIRQQVLEIDEDQQQANSQHHRRWLPCWTTTTFRTSKKKNLPLPSQTKWRSCKNLSNRFSSFLGVHQMILATFKSVNNVQVAGACGIGNPSPRFWAGPGKSRPRRAAPRSGFAQSSPHPRAGLFISGPARCAHNVTSTLSALGPAVAVFEIKERRMHENFRKHMEEHSWQRFKFRLTRKKIVKMST